MIKKRFSFCELHKRVLMLDEIGEVTNMIRRIAAILLLKPQLNANYTKY